MYYCFCYLEFIWIQNRISWFVFAVLKHLRVHSGGTWATQHCRVQIECDFIPKVVGVLYTRILHNTNNNFFLLQRMFDVLNISFQPSYRTILNQLYTLHTKRTRQRVFHILYIYTIHVPATYIRWTLFWNKLHISSSKRQLNTSNFPLALHYFTVMCAIKYYYIILYAWLRNVSLKNVKKD